MFLALTFENQDVQFLGLACTQGQEHATMVVNHAEKISADHVEVNKNNTAVLGAQNTTISGMVQHNTSIAKDNDEKLRQSERSNRDLTDRVSHLEIAAVRQAHQNELLQRDLDAVEARHLEEVREMPRKLEAANRAVEEGYARERELTRRLEEANRAVDEGSEREHDRRLLNSHRKRRERQGKRERDRYVLFCFATLRAAHCLL
jgi:hypothetical protein